MDLQILSSADPGSPHIGGIGWPRRCDLLCLVWRLRGNDDLVPSFGHQAARTSGPNAIAHSIMVMRLKPGGGRGPEGISTLILAGGVRWGLRHKACKKFRQIAFY